MRRTKEDAEKTRDAILNAAVKLFSEQGVTATSLEGIAKLAKVTRGAIYWHFKNKAEIFDALHERLYQPLTTMILEDMELDHPAPLSQMQELCTKLLLDMEANAQKQQALTLFLMQSNYVGEMAELKDKHWAKKEASLKLFFGYFEKAKQKGMLPQNADPETLTLAVRCYMKGIVVEYLNAPETFDLSSRAAKLMALLFDGLTQPV